MAKYWVAYLGDMNLDKPPRLASEEVVADTLASAQDQAWSRTFEISEAYGYRIYQSSSDAELDERVLAEEHIFDLSPLKLDRDLTNEAEPLLLPPIRRCVRLSEVWPHAHARAAPHSGPGG